MAWPFITDQTNLLTEDNEILPFPSEARFSVTSRAASNNKGLKRNVQLNFSKGNRINKPPSRIVAGNKNG
jgi:hypothetical protein